MGWKHAEEACWRAGRVFQYFEHPNLEREEAFEGKYLIQTEEKGLTPVEAVQGYKELSEVGQGFRQLKDAIGMRPIYHRNRQRVQGYIFLAALVFLMQRALAKKLKARLAWCCRLRRR